MKKEINIRKSRQNQHFVTFLLIIIKFSIKFKKKKLYKIKKIKTCHETN